MIRRDKEGISTVRRRSQVRGAIAEAHVSRTDPRRSVARKYAVPDAPIKKWVPKPISRDQLDWGFVADILAARYGSPRLGNPEDPLDCLVYVMLTRKTDMEAAQRAFARLKKSFRTWDDALRVGQGKLVRLLHGTGLEEQRARDLRAALELIRGQYGKATLEPLRRLSNKRCLEFLVSLPGVGTKTARCTMLYTLGRRVFPADAHCIRILARMGVLRPSMEHRQAQEALADIIPGRHAYALHVNLVAHGQQTCTPTNPRHEDCVVRKLCRQYREEQERHWRSLTKTRTALDLFCGAGGTSLGLQAAGYRILAGVDEDLWACQTFRLNHPELPEARAVHKDIESLTGPRLAAILDGERPDVVIGGPPCQGFSMIGKRARGNNGSWDFVKDPRNHLYRHFVRLVRHFRPKIVVMENVPGICMGNHDTERRIRENLSRVTRRGPGYSVVSLEIAASSAGVPQRRRRWLFIGVSREHFEASAEAIADHIKRILEHADASPPTLRNAIADLPTLGQNDGEEVVRSSGGNTPISSYAAAMNARWPVIHNHVSRPLNVRDQKLYALLSPGQTGHDAVTEHGARHLMVYRDDVFHDKYRRLVYDTPSPTIVAHLSKDGHMFIHPDPDQNRSITVREAARIQSFPDDFILYGPRTSQFRQVGNAVPPLLAKSIGDAISEAVSRSGRPW